MSSVLNEIISVLDKTDLHAVSSQMNHLVLAKIPPSGQCNSKLSLTLC